MEAALRYLRLGVDMKLDVMVWLWRAGEEYDGIGMLIDIDSLVDVFLA